MKMSSKAIPSLPHRLNIIGYVIREDVDVEMDDGIAKWYIVDWPVVGRLIERLPSKRWTQTSIPGQDVVKTSVTSCLAFSINNSVKKSLTSSLVVLLRKALKGTPPLRGVERW